MARVPKYPVSEGWDSSRSSRRGPIEIEDVRRKPLPAPASITDKRARAIWSELTSSPLMQVWTSSDLELLARLALLRRRFEFELDEAPAWLYSALAHMEDRLYLNPRSRRLAGIVIVPAKEAGNGDKLARALAEVKPLSAARRRRIERG
jgi:hypothetical protein